MGPRESSSMRYPGTEGRRTARAGLFLIAIFCIFTLPGPASAQGTKDPSNPAPTMVFPVRPVDEPARPTAVPTNPVPPQPPIQLEPIYRGQIRTNGAGPQSTGRAQPF